MATQPAPAVAKKTVLITGCSLGGIGDALAQEFHRRGLRVFATARSMSKMAHLKDLGIETLTLDVTSTKSITGAVSQVSAAAGGRLDFLINNSGQGLNMPVLDVDVDAVRRLFEVNFFALLTVTQAFMPLLIAARGTVINNTSIAASLPGVFMSAYATSKAAASSLTSAMRNEFRCLGVKVVELKTGTVRTPIYGKMAEGQAQQGGGIPDDSYYRPAKEEVEKFLAGKMADEKDMMPVDVFARKVIDDLLPAGGSSPVLWRGSGALAVRLLAAITTVGMLDYLSGMITGLHAVEKKMA